MEHELWFERLRGHDAIGHTQISVRIGEDLRERQLLWGQAWTSDDEGELGRIVSGR